MSCVNYWNECTNNDCKNVGYDRQRKSYCVKCGAENDTTKEWDEENDTIKEWDEEGDHDPED